MATKYAEGFSHSLSDPRMTTVISQVRCTHTPSRMGEVATTGYFLCGRRSVLVALFGIGTMTQVNSITVLAVFERPRSG